MLLEGQFDKLDFDFGLVVLDRIIPLVLGKDRDICSLVDDPVPVRVLAALGCDALVPEPFVSAIFKVSIALRLDRGSGRASNPASNLHFDETDIRCGKESAGSRR